MSIEKTKFMIFRTVNSSSVGLFDEISFKNVTVKSVEVFKYLGLYIDNRLTWKYHVANICSKISPFVGVISRIRYVVDKATLMSLYYAHIHSRLTYCLPVWSGCSLELKMRLQRLQNKVIKYVNFKPYLTPSHTIYNKNFLSFLKLCDYETVLFIHKVHTGLVKSDLTLKTNDMVVNRVTRQSNLIRLPQFTMAKSQSSVFYSGIQKYNEFLRSEPLARSKSTKISVIKSKIKSHVQ
jgi:hypothetical protein